MRRTVRLTERDLTRLVRRVIREGEESSNITSAIQTAKQKFAAGDENQRRKNPKKNQIQKLLKKNLQRKRVNWKLNLRRVKLRKNLIQN